EAYSSRSGWQWSDVWRLPLDGSPIGLAAKNPGNVGEWLADGSGRVRLALAIQGATQELRRSPTEPGGAWTTIMTLDFRRDPARLLALSTDGQRAWVAARMGRDTRGVYEVDLLAQRIARARWTDAEFDFDGTVAVLGNQLIGVNFEAERPLTTWVSPEMERVWSSVNAPGQPREFSADGRRGLFYETRDRLPGQWWLVDRDGGSARVVTVNEVPRSPEGQLMMPVAWIARDGIPLHGYITRPTQGNGVKPPLAVMVHGGPWTRDTWGWQPEVQFLADRGWAVLQVNYRGSTGFGWDFQRLGAGHWNIAVNDLADGARWVVAQGWAHPERLVVVGASFGGFLSAMALTRAEEPFRAAASLGGVFDLPQWLRQASQREPRFVIAAQRAWIYGDERPAAEAVFVPPRGIRDPLLLIHARDDDRVAFDQSAEFAEELRDLRIPVAFVVVPSGGHTFGQPEERARLWEQVEAFLRREVESR
ncbi:MAG TPA: prolyl oligopeptidase family serine peptidase, partial [Verrucomicrobiota bacterium]|nr:prolyl oligopeptidase family serine peptidase [Verrucomicrobiota bacterium]